jgi:hypothetical protein
MLGNSIMKKVIVDLTCLASMKSKIDWQLSSTQVITP